METNHTFESIRNRRSARHFSQRTISDEKLYALLELANRAPSGFNLQPWHFIIVSNSQTKELLSHAAMGQTQIIEAPRTIVFVADPDAWKNDYPRIIEDGLSAGAITPDYATFLKKTVKLSFSTGPMGLFGLAKKIALPLRRLKMPTPHAMTSHHDAVSYVRMHTMFAAATFMVAAKASGFDTCPMEGFDEFRVKKLLNVPASMTIPVMVPIGHALELDEGAQSIRLPVEDKLHVNQFQQR